MDDSFELQGGLPVRVTPEQAQENVVAGTSNPITPELARAAQKQENDRIAALKAAEASGTPPWAAGLVTGATSAGTAGLGPAAMLELAKLSGSNPARLEEIRSRMRGSSGLPWHTAGQALGYGLSAIATSGIGPEIQLGGESLGFLGSSLRGASSLGVRGAVEGAILGAGGQIERNALENKPLAAEALLATGEGALLGAFTGGALGGLGGAAKFTGSKISDVISSSIAKTVNPDKAINLLEKLGAKSATMTNIAEEAGGTAGFAKAATEMLEPEGLRLSSKPGLIRDVAQKNYEQAEGVWTKTLKELDKSTEHPQWTRFVKNVEDTVIGERGIQPGGMQVAEKISKWLDKMAPERGGLAKPTNFSDWSAGRELVQKSSAKFGSDSQKIMSAYDAELTNSAQAAEALDSTLMGASGRLEAAKNTISLTKNLQDLMTDRISGVKSPWTQHDIATGGAIALAGHPGSALAYTLGKTAFRGISDQIGPKVAESVWRASAGINSAAAVSNLKASVSKAVRSYLSTGVVAGSRAITATGLNRESYDKEINNTYNLLQRPRESRMNDYIRFSKSMALAEEMARKSDNAVQYTQENIPPAHAKKGHNPNTFRATPAPSALNINEHLFLRKHGVVKSPFSLLKDMEGGRISKDSVAALKSNWPEIHNLVVNDFQQEIAAMKIAGKTLPMAKITQLSILLDRPLDITLTPGFIQPVQAALAEPSKEEQSAGKGVTPVQTSADTTDFATPIDKQLS